MKNKYRRCGVKCTPTGYPICCIDEELCDVEKCEYYVNDFNVGNCSLRYSKESTLEQIGMVFGMTREGARLMVNKAIGKFKNIWKGRYSYRHRG